MAIAISDIELYETLKAPLGENGAKALVSFLDTKVERGFGRLGNARSDVSASDLYEALKNPLGDAKAKLLVSRLETLLDARIAQRLGEMNGLI
jgi:hypothetical protein